MSSPMKPRHPSNVASGDQISYHDPGLKLIRERDQLRADLAEFRDKLAALAAIEEYIGESGENAARNMRHLLAGTGEHDNDPRVQARAWGLEWADPPGGAS